MLNGTKVSTGCVGVAGCLIMLMLTTIGSSAPIGAAAPVIRGSPSQTVLVAIPDRFPAPARRALVVRFGEEGKPDLVVLNPEHVQDESLFAAWRLLDRLAVDEVPTGTVEVTAVLGFAPLHLAALEKIPPGVPAVLNQLRDRPRSRIGNLGPGRWLEVPTELFQP